MDRTQWIEQLINKHSAPLIRYVTSILKDKEAAKEIVQDSFLSLLEQNESEVKTNAQAWLFRWCRNRAIDVWRRRRREQSLSDNQEEHLSFADADPFRDLETQQDTSRLRAEIARLPARHQEILWLKYKDDLSYKEIGDVMGITSSNVGFILSEAVKALREAALMSSILTRKLK